MSNFTSAPINRTVTERDLKELEKAHRYEEKLKRKGFRWVVVNPRLKVFAECDRHGMPTAEGLARIERMKQRLEGNL